MRHLRKVAAFAGVTVALAGTLASATASPTAVVVTSNSVGPLRLDHSRAAGIRQFAGRPALAGSFFLQYRCSRHPRGCKITYQLRSEGKMKGRLVAVMLNAGSFRTVDGITIGMSEAAARQLAPRDAVMKLCRNTVLRSSPVRPGAPDPWPGLTILISKGKVNGFLILSTHVRVGCNRTGGFLISS